MVDGWSCACALGSASSGQGGAVRYRCRPSTWLRHSIFLILFFVHTHFLSVGNSVSRPSLYTNTCGSLSHDFNGGSLLPLKTDYCTCGCRMLLHQNLHTTMPTASVKNKMGGVLYFFLPLSTSPPSPPTWRVFTPPQQKIIGHLDHTNFDIMIHREVRVLL